MKKLNLIVIFFLLISHTKAQDTTRVDETTTEENIALITMTGIIIPLALIGTIISAIPPSISVVIKEGVVYGGVSVESGIGFGEKRVTGIFSDWRMNVSYTYIINEDIRDLFRAEVKRDFHFDFVDRRKIFLSGFHLSAGVLTDFPDEGYTIGAGGWVKSPWLNYFGFFPQHTFGVTYRYNKYFDGKDFHEISLGVTSAFTY